MTNNIIVVKQLPIIEERLRELKADIESRTSAAMSMECTEDTVKEVKKIRAELNKECKEYEDQRKAVKKAVIAPYEAFEGVYKECVTIPFKKADSELKSKISAVEEGLKEQKKEKLIRFAEELKASYSLDWLNINRVLPTITLSASESSLIEKVSEKLDSINTAVKFIDDPEVFAEYKKSLDPIQAQLIVANRRKEIEEAKAQAERKVQQEEVKQEAAKKVEALAPPKVEEKPTVSERKFVTSFTIKGTLAQIKALKAYIKDNNIEIVGGK